MLLSDYISQVQELVHDSSAIDFTPAELTAFVNNARTRVALDFHCVRTFFTGLNVITNQETYPMFGGIGGVQVISGGQGYTDQTVLQFSGPTDKFPTAQTSVLQLPAAGTPVIVNGVITGAVMTSWGSGYSDASGSFPFPITGAVQAVSGEITLTLGTGDQNSALGFCTNDTVVVAGVTGTVEANSTWRILVIITATTARVILRGSKFLNAYTSGGTIAAINPVVRVIDPGGGFGAQLTVSNTALINVIDFLSVSFLFGTMRTMLQWKVFTYFQAIFRSNILLTGQPAAWSNYTEANLWYLYPVPDQPYVIEIDAVVLPHPLLLQTDNDLQIIQPMADCVQYYAAWLALMKLQNFEQATYMKKTYEERFGQIQRTRQSRRVANIYQTVWRRLQRGW